MVDITENLHHDVYPPIDPRGALRDSCKDKVVLITGAGRGIGKAIALAFAFAGASTLVLTARSGQELEETRKDILAEAQLDVKPSILTHVTDVVSDESVRDLFKHLDREGVVVDVLINNAGYLEPGLLVHKTDPIEWWTSWEANVKGTYLPTHFFLKQRFNNGSPPSASNPATVICSSSIGAVTIRAGYSAYSPGKTGVNRFVEFLHAEYGGSGVRAFSYHPGGVMTKLACEGMPLELHSILLVDKAELPAGFVVWLASQRATDTFRGKYVSANWDVDEILRIAAERAGDAA